MTMVVLLWTLCFVLITTNAHAFARDNVVLAKERTSCFSLLGPKKRWTSKATRRNNAPPETTDETKNVDDTTSTKQRKIQELLQTAKKVGQVGSVVSQEQQDELLQLAKDVAQYTDPEPARIPLTGTHRLIYSAAKGGSSGKIGPFIGSVTQQFINEDDFINAVQFGPLKIALRAHRTVKSDTRIVVQFLETTISIFDDSIELVKKEVSGGGVWNYLFSGTIQDDDGKKKLIRIMETPSLFIIEQDL